MTPHERIRKARESDIAYWAKLGLLQRESR